MPYPTSIATAKHDIVLTRGELPPDEVSLRDAWGFASAKEMFRALEQPPPPPQATLSSIYSYKDAPHPPLARALAVVGVADVTSIGALRKLIGDGTDDRDEIADCIRKCSIAVKRGDGHHYDDLPPDAAAKSMNFANLMRRLGYENLVAVVGVDKQQRFVLLRPSEEMLVMMQDPDASQEYQSFDFYATCYVGKLSHVKAYLNGGGSSSSNRAVPKPTPVAKPPRAPAPAPAWTATTPPPDDGAEDDDDGPKWNPDTPPGTPPGEPNSENDNDDDDRPKWHPGTPPGDPDGPSTDDPPQWHPGTPPGTPPGGGFGEGNVDDSGNDDDGGMWKPPGEDGGGVGGDDSGGDGMWQPPSGAGGGGGGDGGMWQPPGDTGGSDAVSGAGLWAPGGDDTGGGTIGNGGDAVALPWETNAAENDTNENSRKRSRSEAGDDCDGFHADSTAAAADKFYSNLTRTLDTRSESRIFHMRAFNGWVKATQIQELDPKTRSGKGRPIGEGPMRVLDLACGKGGDLGKWVLHPRGMSNYVGSDVARGSLKDAAIRARAKNMRARLKKCTFTCADLGADVPGRYRSKQHKVLQKLCTWSLQNEPPGTEGDPEFKMVRGGGISLDDRFDVVSIQFAIHYMMSTRKRARRFFQTVSELLEVGGNLIATTIDARVVIGHMMDLGLDLHRADDDDAENIENGSNGKTNGKRKFNFDHAIVKVGNGVCQLKFEPEIVERIFYPPKDVEDPLDNLFGLEYTFTLVEGSDHEKGVGDAVNLPEWLTPIPVLKSLGEEVGLELEYTQNFHEFWKERRDPSKASAAHSSMYNMKVLNRNGSIAPDEWEISRMYMAVKFRKVRESVMNMDDDEAGVPEEEDDDGDEPEEIDPKIKAKFLPMAMMKAKKAVGNDIWQTMSSDEKTALTDAEVRKLAGATK